MGLRTIEQLQKEKEKIVTEASQKEHEFQKIINNLKDNKEQEKKQWQQEIEDNKKKIDEHLRTIEKIVSKTSQKDHELQKKINNFEKNKEQEQEQWQQEKKDN